MARKLLKFLILFDNTNLLYFPGQFLSGRVLVELEEDTPALGRFALFTDGMSLRERDNCSGVPPQPHCGCHPKGVSVVFTWVPYDWTGISNGVVSVKIDEASCRTFPHNCQ
ncbi:hypothetical protein J437_LFUL003475 [Ladona fulva]|uniref:Uncharacterized protein n=1 Tax=Ladona fulva TaxID=123851 RepID=A0A8K0NU00_LADFU|nr:hypothetical protein J437_LFUL003475 [Ladona fulva]